MKSFTERHHAYISAMYYKFLKDGTYPNYRQVFIRATQKMAEQRGSRMAQRAIRDGVTELDFAAYRYYGEWEWTPQYLETVKGKKIIEEIDSDKDYGYIIYKCPWADVYHEEGLALDGGADYCLDLDPSIVRGFNPELEYKTTQTLQECDKCIQYQINGKIDQKNVFGEKRPENMKSFDYQCGNVFKTFSDYMIAIYGTEGITLNTKVLERFTSRYGKDMADVLISFLKTDFNVI